MGQLGLLLLLDARMRGPAARREGLAPCCPMQRHVGQGCGLVLRTLTANISCTNELWPNAGLSCRQPQRQGFSAAGSTLLLPLTLHCTACISGAGFQCVSRLPGSATRRHLWEVVEVGRAHANARPKVHLSGLTQGRQHNLRNNDNNGTQAMEWDQAVTSSTPHSHATPLAACMHLAGQDAGVPCQRTLWLVRSSAGEGHIRLTLGPSAAVGAHVETIWTTQAMHGRHGCAQPQHP